MREYIKPMRNNTDKDKYRKKYSIKRLLMKPKERYREILKRKILVQSKKRKT